MVHMDADAICRAIDDMRAEMDSRFDAVDSHLDSLLESQRVILSMLRDAVSALEGKEAP
jgi:hypothetical protein